MRNDSSRYLLGTGTTQHQCRLGQGSPGGSHVIHQHHRRHHSPNCSKGALRGEQTLGARQAGLPGRPTGTSQYLRSKAYIGPEGSQGPCIAPSQRAPTAQRPPPRLGNRHQQRPLRQSRRHYSSCRIQHLLACGRLATVFHAGQRVLYPCATVCPCPPQHIYTGGHLMPCSICRRCRRAATQLRHHPTPGAHWPALAAACLAARRPQHIQHSSHHFHIAKGNSLI